VDLKFLARLTNMIRLRVALRTKVIFTRKTPDSVLRHVESCLSAQHFSSFVLLVVIDIALLDFHKRPTWALSHFGVKLDQLINLNFIKLLSLFRAQDCSNLVVVNLQVALGTFHVNSFQPNNLFDQALRVNVVQTPC
jgi:hypothetical protein